MNDAIESRHRLRGLFNITVTPFRIDGGVDDDAVADNIERVLALGYDGLLIGGTYGEFASMSADTRAALFRRAITVAGDRVPVVLCSAGSDPQIVAELTSLAGDLGGVPMLLPPYACEATETQIIAFFRSMAARSRTGIVIYNAPGLGVTLAPPLLERLADLPQVVGLKQGDLTPTAIDQIANRLSGRLRLFCASDLTFPGPLMAGFDGLSSTNSCALPELILGSFRACMAGDAARVRWLHRLWFPYRELARDFGQPQTVKAAMTLRGWTGGCVRPPLSNLDREQIGVLRPVLSRILESGLADDVPTSLHEAAPA
jgi:4-hydroxy-tetrahydrodipicolinate synthase